MKHPSDIAPLVAAAHRAEQPGLLGTARDADAALPWTTINALLRDREQSHGRRGYLTFVDNEAAGRGGGADGHAITRMTYAETVARVARLVRVLRDLGLEAGDTISTVDRFNHSDTVCLLLAAWCAGLRVAPLNVEEDDTRLAFILSNAHTKVAFVRAAHLDQIMRVNVEARVPTIVTMGSVAESTMGDHGGIRLEGLEARTGTGDPAILDDAPAPETEAMLVYTSGTTGHPKGVVLSHRMLFNVASVVDFHGFTAKDVFATAMRLFHVNAIITSMMSAMVAGGRLVLMRRWDPKGFWALVANEKVTTTSVVPAMLADLLRVGGAPPATIFEHFKVLICGAGTLKRSLAEQWLDTHPVRITHGWGMSETTCWGCWLPHDLSNAEYRELMLGFEAPSIGTPHGWNRMAIHDSAGRSLPAGEKGQIVLAGSNVMEGYFERDDANADTFKHSVLETGDEGFWRADSQGRPMFFITGRLKDIIERGGEKFSPYEMDDEFTAMPGVVSALVFGFAHERLGQEIGVVLELEADVAAASDPGPFSTPPRGILVDPEAYAADTRDEDGDSDATNSDSLSVPTTEHDLAILQAGADGPERSMHRDAPSDHDSPISSPADDADTTAAGITLEDVQRYALERGYSWAKAPKELRLVPSIPKTATGKETRKMFADLFTGCDRNHYKKPAWWTGG